MSDFDFDQTPPGIVAPPTAYAELSPKKRARVDRLVRVIRMRQRDGQATMAADFVGFTHAELAELLPVARQRMQAITFRQDDLPTALADEVAREATPAGDLPDERAVEIAVAAASGLVPSDSAIVGQILVTGISARQLGDIWPRVKARLGAHTAAATRMPEVA